MQNLISDLCTEISNFIPGHKAFVNESLNFLEKSESVSLSALAESYAFLVRETLKEQLYFKRNKKYRYSKYSEVSESIYNNNLYMQKYMTGLAISSFLWPNHIRIKRFFENIIKTIDNKSARYLEIGPGHGIFFMIALANQCAKIYDAVDISPTSIKMTTDILTSGYFGEYSNFQITECDFLDYMPTENYDHLVMGEVIEHVEQPIKFLNKAYELTTENPLVFITTCINSPEIDHIYLFSTADEVSELIAESGFRIRQECILSYNGTTLERSIEEHLPINVAYVLGK